MWASPGSAAAVRLREQMRSQDPAWPAAHCTALDSGPTCPTWWEAGGSRNLCTPREGGWDVTDVHPGDLLQELRDVLFLEPLGSDRPDRAVSG